MTDNFLLMRPVNENIPVRQLIAGFKRRETNRIMILPAA
jgi:hypothetical protein